MNAARTLAVCFFMLSALHLSGCQQKPTALSHVSGKVSYKGASLQGGIIVFTPDSTRGESGKIAFSKIQPDGSYTLSTDDTTGAVAGWYRVTVASLVGPTSLDGPAVSVIDPRYRDPQLSQLQCEVKGNRDNHLDFNLD
jgi:hypothetical protein